MADGLILFWVVIGGSLTPLLRRRLVPKLIAIPLDWRVRFVLLCTTMALLEEVTTTTMTNLAPLLGTTPEDRRAKPPRWWSYPLAVVLPFPFVVLAAPVVLLREWLGIKFLPGV
jgi:hypothetical protein